MTSTEAARAGTARLSWYKKLCVPEKRTWRRCLFKAMSENRRWLYSQDRGLQR